MVIALDLPSITDPTAFHLKRWEQVCADPSLQMHPGRVETNLHGYPIMMPPPGFQHSSFQGEICALLRSQIHSGRALTECAILTTDGIKGADAAWISTARVKRGLKKDVLTIAPEICVEVFSPSNTKQQLEAKRALYFAAGADEVWFCDRRGNLHFFGKDAPDESLPASPLCPTMPRKVKPR
jgi:Uma2 family endonuclease